MSTKQKGRPSELKKEMRNADRVSLRMIRDRSLVEMSDLGGQNPLSGRKLKGQQRAARSLTKEVLPEVAHEIAQMPQEDQESLAPRTLERHYAKHGAGSVDRISAELAKRLRQRDAEKASATRALSEKQRPLVEELNRLAKAQQQPKVREVIRKNKTPGRR